MSENENLIEEWTFLSQIGAGSIEKCGLVPLSEIGIRDSSFLTTEPRPLERLHHIRYHQHNHKNVPYSTCSNQYSNNSMQTALIISPELTQLIKL